MSTFTFRPEIPPSSQRIVIKIGSQAITHDQGGLDTAKFQNIIDDIVALHQAGLDVVIVSSGAIHTGRVHLPHSQQRPTIDYHQACSALGQPLLMKHYIECFEKYHLQCAQVLLTHDDLKDRTRYLNARQTLQMLLQYRKIPVLNENDSVSFNEISVGDNDQLAAMVTEIIEGDVLCLLTGPDGLFNRDPHQVSKDPLIHYTHVSYEQQFAEVKLISKSLAGRGGMRSKLLAVRKVTPLGISVIMGTYKHPSPILRLFTQNVGSFFLPVPAKSKKGRKAWLLTIVKNDCFLKVDQGAYQALIRGASLLPAGLTGVEGTFSRGDCIGLRFEDQIFAVGLTEYNSQQLTKIQGKKTQDIPQILGQYISAVVIHRDNLAKKVTAP